MTKKELLDELKRLQEQLKELEKVEKIEQAKESWRSKETMKLFKKIQEVIISDFFSSEDGLNEVRISIAGFKVSYIPENVKPKKKDAYITVEKNKVTENISTKESFTAKVQRLSKLNPDLHVTESDKKYPKAAKAWLVKNFGTVEV
jgi:hypothetical protein